MHIHMCISVCTGHDSSKVATTVTEPLTWLAGGSLCSNRFELISMRLPTIFKCTYHMIRVLVLFFFSPPFSRPISSPSLFLLESCLNHCIASLGGVFASVVYSLSCVRVHTSTEALLSPKSFRELLVVGCASSVK